MSAAALNTVGAMGCMVVGLGAGSLHFGLLRWRVRRHARWVPVQVRAVDARASRFPDALSVMLALLPSTRLLVTPAILVTMAQYGAVPLLLAASGILLARPLAVRLLRP